MAVSKVILNGTTLIDVTQDTVASNNLLLGFTATGADGESVSGAYIPEVIDLQEKTVTPTQNTQVVLPDTGKDGLSKVTVNPIPSNYGLITWDGSVLTVS